MKLISVQEYSISVDLSENFIRSLCKRNLLPAIKFGNRWRIDKDAADLRLSNLMSAGAEAEEKPAPEKAAKKIDFRAALDSVLN